MKRRYLYLIIISLVCIVIALISKAGTYKEMALQRDTVYVKVVQLDTIYLAKLDGREVDLSGSPKENLYDALKFYGVKYPDVVYAIAVVETGDFTSELCTKYYNLFGLYDSANKKYYHFNSWHESIIAYRDIVESKYKGEEGYYHFLDKLPYAEADGCTDTLRKTVSKNRSK